jgi:selenocysteine lyase/cysteine desulfurase
MGPLSIPVQEAGQKALSLRAYPGQITPNDFFAPAERTRELCGRLVNADPEKIAFVTTTAAGCAIIANNMQPRSGQNVVMLADQFPSNVYAWRNWQAQGVQMRHVSAPQASLVASGSTASRAAQWNKAILAAIDADTALVAVEQAHWTDGTLFDLEAIGKRCREVGAVYVIDATQTVGAMPLNVQAIQPDALIVHSYKAMLSNYGLGFVVLSDRFADGAPIDESWLMRANSEDFSRLLDYQDGYAAGMRRFDTSLRANPSLIGMLQASCELLLQWQPARTREYLLGIERDFVGRMRAAGYQIADESERAANVFGIELPQGQDSRQIAADLAQRNIFVSVRGSAVRVSPHVYNDENDLATLADALLGT